MAARKAALALDLARDVPEHFVAYDAMARFVGLPANPWAMLLDDFDQPFSARAWTNTTRETPIAEQVARVLAQRFLFCEDEWQHLEVTDLRIADRADVFRRPNT